MSAELWTARISSKDPDRFDITRKSGGPEGVIFAPSWALLRPALAARHRANEVAKTGMFSHAFDIEAGAWAAYVPAYRLEMRASYRAHRGAWDALLERRRVVLVCYCVDGARCHRRLLAGFLVKLGAIDHGDQR